MYICKLFDGNSSQEYAAAVELLDSGFSVVYTDQYGEEKQHQWHFNDVKSIDTPWSGYMSVKVGAYPHQVIESADRAFIKLFKKANTRHIPLYQKLIDTWGMNKAILLALSMVIAVVVVAYCWIIPFMAVQAAVYFPLSYEKQLGESIFQNATRWEETDSVRTALMNKFVSQLALNDDYDIQVTVVESEIVNAYAVPGGNVVIYSGLLDKLTTTEQLVALLGHEVSHIAQRHSLKAMFKDVANYMVISLVLGDVNGITAVLADHANSLNSLSYSRSLEEEADLYGMQLMVANGVDPKGMVGLMEVLEASHGDSFVPEFLSSHPVTSDRIAFAEAYAEGLTQHFVSHPELDALFEKLVLIPDQK